MKDIGLKAALVIFSLLFSLVISEILLRLFWNPDYLNNRFKRDDLEWMKNYVLLNNFGYRDDYVNLKKDDALRIYSLGDSYTFGWYINEGKKAYPNLLESKLNEKFGNKKIEVINAAQPGFTIEEEYDRYVNEGILFAPEVITVGINIYDLAGREFPPAVKRNIFSNLRLYELLVNNSIRKRSTLNTENEIIDATKEDSTQINKLKNTLKKFQESAEKNNSKLILIVFPNYTPSNPNSQYKYFDFHKRINDLANELNIDLIDLAEPFEKIKDKSSLILNPTDPHPSELANEIAAIYISENLKIDENKLTSQNLKEIPLIKDKEFDNLNAIFDINPKENWVYFNRRFELGTQKNHLGDSRDRKTAYMADYLKTAKAFTHQGWPGAQIEYNYPSSGKEINIGKSLYGFPIIGIHQVSGYYRKSGSLNSEYIPLDNLTVKRNQKGINILVESEIEFDFYRILVDVGVKQFDIDSNKIVSVFKTDSVEQDIKENTKEISILVEIKGDKNLSLPTYSSDNSITNYVWLNDMMVKAQIVRNGDQIIVKTLGNFEKGKMNIFYSNEYNYSQEDLPIILYI